MNRVRRSVVVRCSILLVIVLLSGAFASGCSQFRGWVAGIWPASPPAPAALGPRDQRMADAHYRLGRLYQQRSRHRDAVAEFGKALGAEPGSVKALNALGVSLDALGRYEDAAAAYARALALDPALDYVHNNLGYSRLLSGDREGAAASYQEALEINPDNVVARNNLQRLGGDVTAPAASGAPPVPVASPPVQAVPPAAAPAVAANPPAPVAEPAAPESFVLVPVAAASGQAPARPGSVPPKRVSVAELQLSGDVTAPAASGAPPVPVASPRVQAVPPAAAPAVAANPPAPVAEPAAPESFVLVPVAAASGQAPARPGSVLLKRVSVAELRRASAVEVANGSGQERLLDDVVALLAAGGFRVGVDRLDAGARRRRTMILYREGALQPAWQVAQAFPGNQEMKKTDSFASPDASVKVLIGSDMIARRRDFPGAAAKP